MTSSVTIAEYLHSINDDHDIDIDSGVLEEDHLHSHNCDKIHQRERSS